MEGPAYLILTPDGEALSLWFSLDEAIEAAYELVPAGDIYVDAPSDKEYAALSAAIKTPIAANPRRLRVVDDSAQRGVQALAKAMGREGRERIIDWDESVHMSLDEAHARIEPMFPTRQPSAGRFKPVHNATPNQMTRSFLGTNYKTGKGTPNRIISKLKSMTGFSGARVLGLTLLPNTQSFSDPRVRSALRDATKLYGVQRVLDTRLNSCLRATAECASSCLSFSGNNMNSDYNAVSKFCTTQALVHEPEAFVRVLIAAIAEHERKSIKAGKMPLIRLNVLSDIPWELIIPELFTIFPEVQFYDYTKVPGRVVPDNYDLTFSFSGTNRNVDDMDSEIQIHGRRVAVVFASSKIKELYEVQYEVAPGVQRTVRTPTRGTAKIHAEREGVPFRSLGSQALPQPLRYKRRKPGATGQSDHNVRLPDEFLGLPVVDGDESDMRPYDDAPTIVGLRWKIPGLQGVTMEQVKAFVVLVHIVPSGGGHYHAIVPKTPRFDDFNYQVYEG